MLCAIRGEIIKQRRNYFNSLVNYISLIFWPLLTLLTTWMSYKNYSVEMLSKIGINSQSELFLFLLTGFLEYNCFWLMVQSAFFMRNERENGTLEIVFLTPAPRMAIIYGRAMGALYQSIWLAILYGVLLVIILDEKILVVILLGVGIMAITIFSAVVWGGLMNAIFLSSRDADFWFDISDEPMKLFAGVFIPINCLPFIFKIVSLIFPLTYSLEITRCVIETHQVNVKTLIMYLMVNLMVIGLTTVIAKRAECVNRETGGYQLY